MNEKKLIKLWGVGLNGDDEMEGGLLEIDWVLIWWREEVQLADKQADALTPGAQDTIQICCCTPFTVMQVYYLIK